MTIPETSYTVDSRESVRTALAVLKANFDTRINPRESFERTYHDTFDWRLYRQGGLFYSTAHGDGWLLHWQGLDGSTRGRSIADRVPGFASELSGSIAVELGRVTEMRRLLPIVRVESRDESMAILDQRRKTVVRVHLERGIAADAGKNPTRYPMPDRLRVSGVRGYERDLARVTRLLDEQDGLRPQKESELDQAMAALGKRPCSYSSKLAQKLESDLRADDAARRILGALLETMRANEQGMRQDLDSEFLHDFRVAVRRTRSCLGQLKGLFPEKKTQRFRAEFAWLGAITGPTRDLDVYLMNMKDYRARLPGSIRDDLEPLECYLRECQKEEQQRLTREIGSARYRKLVRDWSKFLDVTVSGEVPTAPSADRPVVDVASERIGRAYRRIRKRGSDLSEETPVEVLHRLRIDCKKLRYLLEFFRSLYPKDRIAPLIRSLKRLQDDLGDFNDVGVQTAGLKATAGEMLERKAATTGTVLAMGRLLGLLEERGRSLRSRLMISVGAFVGDDVRAGVRRLLG